jgi:hypothetical protein
MRTLSAIGIGIGIAIILAIAFVIGLVLPNLAGARDAGNRQPSIAVSRSR